MPSTIKKFSDAAVQHVNASMHVSHDCEYGGSEVFVALTQVLLAWTTYISQVALAYILCGIPRHHCPIIWNLFMPSPRGTT